MHEWLYNTANAENHECMTKRQTHEVTALKQEQAALRHESAQNQNKNVCVFLLLSRF